MEMKQAITMMWIMDSIEQMKIIEKTDSKEFKRHIKRFKRYKPIHYTYYWEKYYIDVFIKARDNKLWILTKLKKILNINK